MATAREEGGFGAGGKFRKRPFKRTTQTTPYDRPTSALRNSANINVNNNNGWLSKIVDPAQKLIISSAHRLFASVFRKRLTQPPPPPTVEPEANHEAKEINQELVSTVSFNAYSMFIAGFCTQPPPTPSPAPPKPLLVEYSYYRKEFCLIENLSASRGAKFLLVFTLWSRILGMDCPGVQGAINGHDDPYTSDRGLTELEQILKQKTFTRQVIKSPEVIPSKSLVSYDRKEASLSTPIKENGSGNQIISMPVALDEDIASPAELAKAYMGSRPSKVSPSTLGLRSQAFREESTLMNNRPFSAASPSMSLVPRSSGHVAVSENGFVTPRSRGRSAIYNMARTPYSRLPSTTTVKGAGSSVNSFAGPSSSQSILEKNSLSGSKHGTLKRRSSVLDSDIGSVGPIRRIRQKPNLLTSKTSRLAASGSLLAMRGTGVSDAVQQPSSSMQKPLLSGEAKSFTEVLTERNKDSSIPITSFTPVPSKSSEMASKILQQLDKLVSSREKSPMKLSPSMLRGPALKSLENVDSSMLLENVQDSNKLDGSAHTSLPDARDSTSQKQDKVEENGPTKFISSFDKLVPATNGADYAGNNKDDVARIKTADSALANSNAYSYPQKKRAFQMSAHEKEYYPCSSWMLKTVGVGFSVDKGNAYIDYLELDDDDSSSGAVSTPLFEGREKMGASGMENKTVASEASRVEKPSALSEVNPPNSLLSKTSDLGTAGVSMVAEKSSVLSFPATPSPSMTPPQPALLPTASNLTSKKAALPNETNASPIFKFGEKVASQKESNDVSPTFNSSTINVGKIPQFTSVPSSSVVSELPAVKVGASFDPKPGTSTSPVSFAVGAIDSILKVPESDKAVNQSITKDLVFRTPDTALPASASTSASAPSIFSFGTPANSTSLNNGSLASSTSVTTSSVSPLASNTSTSQKLFNSSTAALPTTDSIAASTTTTSATTPFPAAPMFKFGSSAVLSTSVSPVSATFGVESTEPKTKDASFGNLTGTPIGGTSAFTSTQSSISVGVSPPVTNAGGSVFGVSSAITGTGSSPFGFSAGASSAATSQSLFSNPFTAGSAQASGTGNGVVTSSLTVPVQFGSSATSSSFGFAGNPGFSSSSSPFGSSISAAKPFSSAPTFGLNTGTSLSEANSISCGSGTTPSVFGSSWQAPKSPSLFGSTFSSTTPTFQFTAATSSVATSSAPVFGSSTGGSSSSIFPFTSTAAAAASQPVFGNVNSVIPFGSAPSNNNDQINMEDSMAEDTIQSSTPTVPVFGQSMAPASGYGFGSAAPSNPFQFSSQQNLAGPQNSSLFQASHSSEFNAAAAGGSFSLGTGGGDKSQRKIVRVKGKSRKK
ncbi:hypothetical protein JRO89_XS14G0004700 [Xanthoceras sorbifolium]|uniref:Nuclear pore complex protein n=1 Tax=Xanthoceras sorbifolium TaxID=99658 RepID=A0ABQ8H326_9ROSI|nr:hypothetical protein JRO89_XS14G0004700 [Xanthoceras sorbifolium]